MNISKFNVVAACDRPRRMEVVSPFTGEVLQDDNGAAFIMVYGVGSSVYRNARADMSRKTEGKTLTDEQDRQYGAELLAALTASWGNIEDENGPVEFSRDNAVALYLAQDWLGGQVLNFSMRLKNFDPLAVTP